MEASSPSTNGTTEATTDGAPSSVPMPPVKLDHQGKMLQLEAAKAQSRQTIAQSQEAVLEAQKSALTASLPTTSTTPLEGDITLGDKVGLVSERIAYSLVDEAGERIASAVKDKLEDVEGRLLIVEDRDLVASDWSFEMVRMQLEAYASAMADAKTVLDTATGKLEQPTEDRIQAAAASLTRTEGAHAYFFAPAVPFAAVETAGAAVGAIADLAAMFRSDYSIQANDVTIGGTAIVASIAKHLPGACLQAQLDRFGRLEETGILQRFEDVLKARMEVRRLASLLRSQVVEPKAREADALRAERTANDESRKDEKAKAGLDRIAARDVELSHKIAAVENDAGPAAGAVAASEALVSGFDSLADKLTGAPDGGGLPPLAAAAIRERLHSKSGPYTHVLYANVESAGGESISKRSRWPGRSHVTFLGGAQVSYLLLEVATGKIAAADTESVLGHVKLKLGSGDTDPLERVLY